MVTSHNYNLKSLHACVYRLSAVAKLTCMFHEFELYVHRLVWLCVWLLFVCSLYAENNSAYEGFIYKNPVVIISKDLITVRVTQCTVIILEFSWYSGLIEEAQICLN